MNHDEFIQKGKELVAIYTIETSDKTDDVSIQPDDVYVVWSAKTLQNSKALMSTPISNGMYYELTLNGDKGEIYFDAYKKWENKCIEI